MITLFNIGDEIEVTLRGIVKEYSASESGDCYTILLPEQKNTRVYLNSLSLSKAIKRKEKPARVMSLEEAKCITRYTVCEFKYGISPQAISPNEIQEWLNDGKYIYGETWRCWTELPSEEQRKITPWIREG